MRFGKYNIKHVAWGHLVLFVLVLALFHPDNLYGYERLTAAFLVGMLLSYAMTGDWQKALVYGLGFAILVGLLDPRGPFTDLRRPHAPVYQESFSEFFDVKKAEEIMKKKDIEPAGDMALSDDPSLKAVGDTETSRLDTTKYDENDLEKLLETDDKNDDEKEIDLGVKKDESFETSSRLNPQEHHGGLDELQNLLNRAKTEARHPNLEREDRMTPARAQRETYQLIDTVKQLKETMDAMAPTLKAGKGIIDMYKALDIQSLGIEKSK